MYIFVWNMQYGRVTVYVKGIEGPFSVYEYIGIPTCIDRARESHIELPCSFLAVLSVPRGFRIYLSNPINACSFLKRIY